MFRNVTLFSFYTRYVILTAFVCPFNFQVETPPRVALPAPVLQTPPQAQATFVPALFTASAPNSRVKGFDRGAASLPVAFPFPLWRVLLHLPPSQPLLSVHPHPFLVAIRFPFPRQHKPFQPRYIPPLQLCAILCGPKVLSHHAHPS